MRTRSLVRLFGLAPLLLGLSGAGAVLVAAPLEANAQESALDAARAAAKASPLDVGASVAFGRALRRAGRSTEAIVELRRGARLPLARSGDAAIAVRWELARAFIDRREFEPAMATCGAVGSITGGAAAGHACAAEAQLLHKRATEALDETKQALASGAQSYEAKVAEGLAYELESRDQDAETSLRQAIAWKADGSEAHAWLGRLLVRTLRHDDGVAELRRAVALDPTGAEVSFELAQTLPSGPEAQALLQRAVRERPSFAAAWLRLADVQLDRNDLKAAAASADESVRADPRDAGAVVAVGKIALADGRFDDAIRAGQSALKLVANSARAKLLIADAYAKKGEIDLAIEGYEGAFGFNTLDPTPLVHASEACHLQGRDTTARAFAEKATKEFPEWGPGWVAYGDALSGERDIARARSAYEKAGRASGPVDEASLLKKISALGQ